MASQSQSNASSATVASTASSGDRRDYPTDQPPPLPSNAHAVFSRLDPIIRTLLASMQKGGESSTIGKPRTQQPGNGRERGRMSSLAEEEAAAAASAPNAEKQLLATLRVRSNLIRRLRATIDDICRPTLRGNGNGELEEDSGPETLIALAEFVLLPLILILQRGVETDPHSFPEHGPPPQSSTSSAQEESVYYIRRAAQLRCVEDAATALAAYVKAVSRKRSPLEAPIVIRCLVACTMSLSSVEVAFGGNEDNVDSSKKDCVRDEKKSSGGGSSGIDGDTGRDRGALDVGDECRLALLQCISALFGLAKSVSGSSLSQQIANHMDGALVVRLVGGCMTILQNLVTEAKVRDTSRGNWTLGLATLDTLREMIDSVPFADTWRKVLPGTFAGLFKVALTSSRIQAAGALSSSKLGAKSISIIAVVLRVSLSSGRQTDVDEGGTIDGAIEVVDRASAMESAAAQLFAAASSAGATTTSMSIPSSEDDDSSVPSKQSSTLAPFFVEVNIRLPAPLNVLLGITTVHRSASIKCAVIDLCTTLLVDTRDVWAKKKNALAGEETKEEDVVTNANAVELERAAIECCLSLLGDNDAKVSSEAMDAIQSFRKLHNEQSWKQITSNKIVPRLLDLIQGLPTLARSGRESELRSQIRLVGGYLMVSLILVDDQGNGRKRKKSKEMSKEERRRRSDIAAALACDSVSSIIRMSMTEVFRLDYNTVSVSPQMPSKLLIEQASSSSVFHLTGVNRFLYLRHQSSVASSMEMLRLLGMTMGPKRGALFVDGCIAELCDAATAMSRNVEAQINWLDQSVGLVVLSKEILAASFGGANAVASSTKDAKHLLQQCTDKKSLRILQSLISSVLPIITRPPLWTLPTTLQNAEDESRLPSMDRNEDMLHSYLVSTRGIEAALLEDQRPTDSAMLDTEASASAFCGNAILIGYLMELIGTISILLGELIRPCLATILYPVVEKTSAAHHHHVQQAALLTLEQISQADGCVTVTSFLSKHFDYLVNSVTAKLRQPGGASNASNPHLHQDLFSSGVVEVLLRSLAKEADGNGIDDARNASHVSLLAELLDHVLVAYDDSVSQASKDVQNRAAVGLLKMFDATIAFLRAVMSNAFPQDAIEGGNDAEIMAVEPWLESLAAFKLDARGLDDEGFDCEQRISAREGFERHHASKDRNEMDSSYTRSRSPDGQEKGQPLDKARIASAIAAANSILSRCCYLLSVHDLKVERASCEVMISAFRFLAPAERSQKATESESESTGNASLMSISDCWPSIVERLKMTSQELRAKDCKSTMLIMSESQRETAKLENEIFVAKLFELVTCMCEISGDFMIGRFEHDVWPIFAQLIGHEVMLREQQQGRGKSTRLPKNMSATRRAITAAPGPNSLPNRQQRSLLALLDCTSRCFGCRQLGVGLTGLVSRAGTIILPLLADEGEVGDAAVIAIQALLAADCDSLWRPLLVLSGGHVAPRLFKSTRISGRKGEGLSLAMMKADVREESTLMRRAKELMRYAYDLPEQVIV